MANDRKIEFNLPKLDDIFTNQMERDDRSLKRIYNIPLEKIDPYPDHPFKVRDDEDMMNLVESIKVNGVLTPAIVRRKEDGRYELVAGHRRKRACELAGISTLRAEIWEMTRDEAIIYMVESNFQRSTILPSEKAFAYKMRMEALNRQGQRSDLTCAPLGHKLGEKSRDVLSREAGDSKSQVQRYIRLTELVPDILEMVDEGKMALRPAVELSYIPKDIQEEVFDMMDMEQCTPTHGQAIRMRRMAEEGKLTPEAIEAIVTEEKPIQKEKIVLRGERFRDLFPKDLPISKREDYVAAAMEYYGKYLEKLRVSDRER